MEHFFGWNDTWYSEYCERDVKLSYKVEFLHSEQTPFQKLEIMRNETFGTFMTLDGLVQVTQRDEFIYHEMISHVPMAVNPAIKRVLIIGGGDGGTAREISRYKHIEKIDMIEIDEAVVNACKKHLPQMSSVFSEEPRLNLKFEDGVAFVKSAADGSYDLILVDSTDPEPDAPGEGLFTGEFYRNCFRILADDGILINQHETAFYYDERKFMKNAHNMIKASFPIAKVYAFNMPSYASGYWYFGFASKKYDPVADHKMAEWESFGLKTNYYNSEIHKACFALPNYVKELLETD